MPTFSILTIINYNVWFVCLFQAKPRQRRGGICYVYLSVYNINCVVLNLFVERRFSKNLLVRYYLDTKTKPYLNPLHPQQLL